LGQTGIVPGNIKYSKFLLSSNQMKLTVSRDIADPLYVYYYVSTPESREKIVRESTAAGVPKINVAYLRQFSIELPPIDIQRAIAGILGALDDKIELNRLMNHTLKAMAQTLFKSWFVDFDPVTAKAAGRQPYGMNEATAALFPDRFVESEFGLVPEGWRISTIGQEVRVVGGSTPSTKDAAFWKGGTVSWATPKDLSKLTSPILLETERKITQKGLQQISSGLLPSGTVLLSSRAPIGYLAIAEIPIAINQGFIAMVCEGELPNHYVLLWAYEAMDEILSRAGGTTFSEI